MRITFNATFHIEEDRQCSKDYVHVGNSRYTVDMNTLTSYKFCGDKAPGEIVSRQRKMWVAFRSNDHLSRAGFSLTYEILPEGECIRPWQQIVGFVYVLEIIL